MRSLLANQDALDPTHQTLIGCVDHLASPHPAYRALRVAVEQEDGNRHFGERPRKQEPQSPCHFTGETLYFLAYPFVLR